MYDLVLLLWLAFGFIAQVLRHTTLLFFERVCHTTRSKDNNYKITCTKKTL